MKKISKIANIVPVIAKSDSLTPDELRAFKRRIKAEIDFHGIKVYPNVDFEEEFSAPGSDAERANAQNFQILKVISILIQAAHVVINSFVEYDSFCYRWIWEKCCD